MRKFSLRLKILLIIILNLSVGYSNAQNDTLKSGEVVFSPSNIQTNNNDKSAHAQDSARVKKLKHSNFVFIQPLRIYVGEIAVLYERVNKKNKGTEIGLGYIYPRYPFWLIFYPDKSGYLDLHGYSLWISKKYYASYNNNQLSYFSPELIVRYEYNDNMSVLVDGNYSIISHVSQKRISPSLSAKIGRRSKSGIFDFYFGAGLKMRYAETHYKDKPDPRCGCPDRYKIQYDNGGYLFFLLRFGMKVGFSFKKKV